jgi:hypothetical protein
MSIYTLIIEGYIGATAISGNSGNIRPETLAITGFHVLPPPATKNVAGNKFEEI